MGKSMRERMAMNNNNVLKIGLFGANCSSGRAVTKVKKATFAVSDQNKTAIEKGQ